MKVLALIAFFSVFLLILNDAIGQNVTWGFRTLRDRHLKRAVIYKSSRFLRKVETDFEFNQTDVRKPKLITQIVAVDQYKNDKGGKVTLSKGGLQMDFVKLHFTSQRGHGLNFIVDIYGQ